MFEYRLFLLFFEALWRRMLQVVLNEDGQWEEDVKTRERREEDEELAGKSGMDTRNDSISDMIKWLTSNQ